MMFNGQTIDSGDNSTNIQGKEVTVINNSGLSYSDVKDIAMSVFKSNFYDLGEKVENIIQDRAEKILDDYLEKICSKNPKYIENTQNPDIRYVIYEAQKNYARRGGESTKKLLVETLVNRTVIQGNCIQELVLNEALEIIPKITPKQIVILTLIFINRYVNYRIEYPIEHYSYLNKIIRSDIEIDNNYSIFQHLEYASCLNISVASVDYTMVIESKFPQIKGSEEANKIIKEDRELSLMCNMWNNSQMCNANLTSVGIAIAVANIKVKTGLDYDLGIWIKE
ncbi:hypothetical protein NSA50_17940 [Clostridium sp. DSM 100503]|uniref:LPO_1073/Vpar_1526 family protein n=1 Tax=Clostridium sp. DSM 100503 TaxID=2963282 RepID=UPI002149FF79|nr:LPO_1073/Vpar_1526 family protein [Clostridium sp. DSM 100503]MCR1952886.1 hypothetical protein [Clostridium sp. DSM 100503]